MNAQAMAEAIAGLDAAERAALVRRCSAVLANPAQHNRETVAVCRVVAAR
jgi:phenylpyruvate tautomerase PptA (4-oxalocrotonate tautomerase family)